MKPIPPDAAATLSLTVTDAMTVDFDELGRVHPLYATYWLTKHIEEASRKLVLPYLEEGEEAIGHGVEVAHLAPTLPGMRVDVRAGLAAVDGRRVAVRCEAWNELGDLVGEGRTTQVVLSRDRLDARFRELEDRWRAHGGGAAPLEAERPLAGVRVLDLTRLLAGPYASMVLADLGAEVIKVEEPPLGDLTRHTVRPLVPGGEDAAYFASINRGKKSVVVDLKDPDGLALVKRLAGTCDVVLDNFRPGVLERLGLDADTLLSLNPRLVVCSISAFGQDGPYRDRIAVDLNIQAMSGAMYLTGEGGDRPPLRMGLPIADLGGGVFAVIGILAALERRRRTGRGARVDVGLLDSLAAFLTYMAANYAVTGEEPRPVGSGHHSVVPYQAFRTKDEWVVLTSFSDRLWERICRALDRPDLAGDPRFATNDARAANRDVLVPLLEEELARRTRAEWLERFLAEDAPASPINTVSEVLADPQVRHRAMVRALPLPAGDTLEVVGNPVKFADVEEPDACEPYPLLGEHTTEVLRELGLSDEELARLAARGVIRCREPEPAERRRR